MTEHKSIRLKSSYTCTYLIETIQISFIKLGFTMIFIFGENVKHKDGIEFWNPIIRIIVHYCTITLSYILYVLFIIETLENTAAILTL